MTWVSDHNPQKYMGCNSLNMPCLFFSHIYGLQQGCGNSIVNALELLQSKTWTILIVTRLACCRGDKWWEMITLSQSSHLEVFSQKITASRASPYLALCHLTPITGSLTGHHYQRSLSLLSHRQGHDSVYYCQGLLILYCQYCRHSIPEYQTTSV